MEELLNKLIEKGWKPFGFQYRIQVKYYGCDDASFYEIVPTIGGGETERTRTSRTLRDVVSKESGLWQFVCENGLLEYDADILDKKAKEIGGDMRCTRYEKHYKIVNTDYGTQSMFRYESPEYRLIESALKDESELEDFLLDNIKIGK